MTLVVKGLREFLQATDRAGKETKKMVRNELRESAELVRADAYSRFSHVSPKTARGFRVAVRQRGVDVEQRLAKTTGKQPGWGTRQMKQALIPAKQAKESLIEQRFGHAVERICDQMRR